MSKQFVLTIEKYLKIDRIEVPLEGVVGFVGDNAQGKTTIQMALGELIAGKNDATKIHTGADRAMIKLAEMENGEEVSSVSRIQTQANSRLEAKGLPIGHTATSYLSGLLSDISVNPINLLTANPVEYLKQHLDPGVDPADIPESCTKELHAVQDLKMNSFTKVEMIAKHKEEERLHVRKSMDTAQTIVKDLRVGIPEQPPAIQDSHEAVDRDRQALASARTEIAVINQQKKGLQDKAAHSKSIHVKILDNLQQLKTEENKLVAQLDRIRTQIELYDLQAKESEKKLQYDQSEFEQFEAPTTDQLDEREKDVSVRVARLREHQQALDRMTKLKERETELLKLAERFDQLDHAVKFLKYEVPKKMLQRSDLGVEGIEIRDGQLFVGGVPLARLSTAERAITTTKIAIAIAKRRHHVAICLDGVESLDSENRKEFIQAAQQAGICVLYTRVSSAPEYPHEHLVKDGKIV